MGLLDEYKLFILKQFDINQTIASMLETIYFINTSFSLNSHSFITCEMSTEKGVSPMKSSYKIERTYVQVCKHIPFPFHQKKVQTMFEK